MYEYNAKVTRVIDGDTYDVLFDLGLNVFVHERIRLAGVDTPEKYGRVTDLEARHGEQATRFARHLLEGRNVIVNTNKDKTGKYGRWIATVKLCPPNNTYSVETLKSLYAQTDMGKLLNIAGLLKLPKSAYETGVLTGAGGETLHVKNLLDSIDTNLNNHYNVPGE